MRASLTSSSKGFDSERTLLATIEARRFKSPTAIGGFSVDCDVHVLFARLGHGIPRRTEWIVADFRRRRLVQTMKRLKMLVVQDGVGRF